MKQIFNNPFKKSVIESRKFYINIAEEGAVLSYARGDKLELRLTFGKSKEDRESLLDVLESDTDSPIYLIIDVVDQTYQQQNFPAVSSFSIEGLVQKRLERDFPEDALKGGQFIEKSKMGRQEWMYMLASCPMSPLIQEWLDFILPLPNPLAGILLLPLELGPVVNHLDKGFLKPAQRKMDCVQIFVSANKASGGFRQVAFKNGKIVFTRLIAFTEDKYADVVAGNIEQDLLSSIEYLKRSTLKEGSLLNIYIVVSPDIKAALEKPRVTASSIVVLTPYELSKHLKLSNTALENDQFGDVVAAMAIGQRKPSLPLHTKITKQLYYMVIAQRWVTALFILTIPISLVFLGMEQYKTFNISGQISDTNAKLVEVNKRWEGLKNNLKYNVEDVYKITEIVSLHKTLTGTSQSPLALIAKFNEMRGDDVLVQSIDWQVQKVPFQNRSTTIAKFNVEFRNLGNSYQVLFKNFDAFVKRLKETFSDYNVEYTRLTEKIIFNSESSVIPVEITIKGPK